MKKIHFFILLALVGVTAVTSSFAFQSPQNSEADIQPVAKASTTPTSIVLGEWEPESGVFAHPISNPWARVTKKPFGLHVTPDTSPVDHDIFTGYHTGVDFEVFGYEEDTDVQITAICDGPLKLKTWAKGYGGLAVQECSIDGQPISVIYGHMDVASVGAEVGQSITAGQTIGVLGAGYTKETDGRRKHLHLGVHKGSIANIRGYIAENVELAQWIDVLQYMSR